jgi:SAM-dependent methyltransferase
MIKIERKGVTYLQLPNGTLTCGPLDQSGMLGGTGEADRNEEHNPERLARIKQFHSDPKVLDFGCGNGLFVEFLRDNGIDASGYDKYRKDPRPGVHKLNEYISGDPEWSLWEETYDIVTMVEVIEHTAAPYKELNQIFECLKPGGILMIETSFTNWMNLETDPYINPRIGHSTIFSHAGLDEVMLEKGFEVYGHINRNVRVYQKPEKPFDNKITLITMGQGNPVALKRTLDSFKDVVDEIIFGDVLIFDADRDTIWQYMQDYNLKILRFPFNFIFENGFSATLNELASNATHDWILYMNVSEVIDGEQFIKEQMSKEYNCYSFDHAVDPHRWFRLYNRKELQWGGLIHEEVIGDLRPAPFAIFRMSDTEKDLDDPFKAKVANDVKEMVYWTQLCQLVDHPELRANTHQGWIDFAKEQYEYNNSRMAKKGKRYEAYKEGNLMKYLEDIYTNPEFEKERFESSQLINFQGDRKLL